MQKLIMMASKIHRGQRLDGRKTFYNVLHPLIQEENLSITLWGWLLIIVVGDMLSPTKAHLRASWS